MNEFYEDKKYLYTRFTMTLHDILKENPNFLDDLKMSTDERTLKLKNMFIAKWDIYEVSGETEGTAKLYIKNKFNMYKDYYEELITAYETKIEMLDGKLTSIEIKDKLSSTENKNDNINRNGSVDTTDALTKNDTKTIEYEDTSKETITNEEIVDETTTNYDLPRKITSENTPSSKSERDATIDTNGSDDITKSGNESEKLSGTDTRKIDTSTQDTETRKGDTTKEETKNKTIITKGQENVIDLKKKYMELLRNVYLDFVEKFEPCFLSLFY